MYLVSENGALLCPVCGCENLHSMEVVKGFEHTSFSEDDILISFHCDDCPIEPILRIANDKRNTVFEWFYNGYTLKDDILSSLQTFVKTLRDAEQHFIVSDKPTQGVTPGKRRAAK